MAFIPPAGRLPGQILSAAVINDLIESTRSQDVGFASNGDVFYALGARRLEAVNHPNATDSILGFFSGVPTWLFHSNSSSFAADPITDLLPLKHATSRAWLG